MVRGFVVLDIDLLAAPWLDSAQFHDELAVLRQRRIVPVVLGPEDLEARRRQRTDEESASYVRATGWRAWLALLARVRTDRLDHDLDARLAAVGPWLEARLSDEEPLRVVVVSLRRQDELLEVVRWAADQRADGRAVGMRHLQRNFGQPAEGLARELLRRLALAGEDARAVSR